MDIKKLIADSIKLKIEDVELQNLIIESISADKGDYALPCFSLAKTLHQNPNIIAQKIVENVDNCKLIDKCEIVNGYVNFFLNKAYLSSIILSEFNANALKLNIGDGKTACVDYCSPNLAKYLHIGHLKSLIEGESLSRLLEQCGFVVKRLDFTGDYGTPFGKIIGGLQRWGSVEEVKTRGNDALQEYYVKYNAMEAEDPTLTDQARYIFKQIEDKDPQIYELYKFIIEIAKQEEQKSFETLGIKFDDHRGEMYYNQKTADAIRFLQSKGLLTDSENAKVVDLDAFGLGVAIIIKSDGTTIYLTRDIAAALDRYNDYKFDKLFYVTDVAQVLHFKQLIKIIELCDEQIGKNMEHVPYGRFSLPDGKISSRRGKQAVLADLLEYALNKAKDVIKDRSFILEDPNQVAQKVARSVLNYSVLKVERNKDCVFDMEKAFAFDGETSPYMQYTYTRLTSILRKYQDVVAVPDYTCFDVDAFTLVKDINNFANVIKLAMEKRDASIVAKQVMSICKTFNHFYTSCKIIDGNENTTKAKINLVKALVEVLKVGFNIICIDTLEEM